MSYSFFVGLLAAYALVVAVNFALAKASHLPEEVARLKSVSNATAVKNLRFPAVAIMLLVLVLGLGLTGFAGLVLGWPVAPWLFAAGVAGKIAALPLRPWYAESGWKRTFSDLELLLDGVIITCAFIRLASGFV